jgi:hypothetical protein
MGMGGPLSFPLATPAQNAGLCCYSTVHGLKAVRAGQVAKIEWRCRKTWRDRLDFTQRNGPLDAASAGWPHARLVPAQSARPDIEGHCEISGFLTAIVVGPFTLNREQW